MLSLSKHLSRSSKRDYLRGSDASTSGRQMSMTAIFAAIIFARLLKKRHLGCRGVWFREAIFGS
jgi:hypothetical protein